MVPVVKEWPHQILVHPSACSQVPNASSITRIPVRMHAGKKRNQGTLGSLKGTPQWYLHLQHPPSSVMHLKTGEGKGIQKSQGSYLVSMPHHSSSGSSASCRDAHGPASPKPKLSHAGRQLWVYFKKQHTDIPFLAVGRQCQGPASLPKRLRGLEKGLGINLSKVI